jgi:hypothetical protein
MPYNPNEKGLGFKNKKLNKPPTQGGAPSMPTRMGPSMKPFKRPWSDQMPNAQPMPSDRPDPRMPYTPSTDTKPDPRMPYKPSMAPRSAPRQLGYSMDGIDGRDDPPGYDRTMEYQPARDGSAWGQIPTSSGGAGAQNYGGGGIERQDPGDDNYEDDNGEGRQINEQARRALYDQALGELNDLGDQAMSDQNGGDWSESNPVWGRFRQKWVDRAMNTGMSRQEAEAWVDQVFDAMD